MDEWAVSASMMDSPLMARPELLLREVADGRLDPVSAASRFWAAVATACDAPGGDPVLALTALRCATPLLRTATALDPTEVRARTCSLQARLYRRLGYCREAFRIAYDTLFWLETLAGDRQRLVAILQGHRR